MEKQNKNYIGNYKPFRVTCKPKNGLINFQMKVQSFF